MIDRIRKFLLSPAGYALYDVMVNRPEEFSVHEYTIVHVPSKATFWVADSGWFFDGKEHAKHSLGSLERHYLYRVFKKQHNRSIAKRLQIS